MPSPKRAKEIERYLGNINHWLTRRLGQTNSQVNRMAEGRISARYNAESATPTQTVTTYAQGDFIHNTDPAVAGTAGSKYVVIGWSCVSAGNPGEWVQVRGLTGT